MSTMTMEVRSDFADRTADVEQLLIEVVQSGRTELLTSERAYVAREMGWDEVELKRQLRRVANILRLRAIAGSPADREAALTECQVSADLLTKEEPKILAKIQELQVKLSGLQRDASTAQKRVTAQAEAVQQLRQFVPPDVKEKVQQAVKAVEAGIGQDLRNAQARHHELKCILNPSLYESQDAYLEFGLKNLLPAAVTAVTDGNMIRRRFSPEWPALKEAAETEFRELAERLPTMQAEYDAAIEQAESGLDFYANGSND